MNPPAIYALQAIVVAALIFFGQWVAARASRKAAESTIEVDLQERATQAWQKYAEEMRERIDRLEEDVENFRTQQTLDRRRIAALERQTEQDTDLIRRLLGRLRIALGSITTLSGHVDAEDMELVTYAQHRLDQLDHQ